MSCSCGFSPGDKLFWQCFVVALAYRGKRFRKKLNQSKHMASSYSLLFHYKLLSLSDFTEHYNNISVMESTSYFQVTKISCQVKEPATSKNTKLPKNIVFGDASRFYTIEILFTNSLKYVKFIFTFFRQLQTKYYTCIRNLQNLRHSNFMHFTFIRCRLILSKMRFCTQEN